MRNTIYAMVAIKIVIPSLMEQLKQEARTFRWSWAASSLEERRSSPGR